MALQANRGHFRPDGTTCEHDLSFNIWCGHEETLECLKTYLEVVEERYTSTALTLPPFAADRANL